MADPGLDIATKIGAASLTFGATAIALNTNVFPGPRRAAGGVIPEACVFCLETGSYPPADFFGGSTTPLRPAVVQVYVRGPQGDYSTTRTTARAVWSALHKATITGYVSVRCQQAEPVFIGYDDTEHPTFSVNVIAEHGSVTS